MFRHFVLTFLSDNTISLTNNKLGLCWAKLSSSWDWTLLQFYIDLVLLDIVLQNWFGRFCFVDFNENIWFGKFGSLQSNNLLGRFIFVDWVL